MPDSRSLPSVKPSCCAAVLVAFAGFPLAAQVPSAGAHAGPVFSNGQAQIVPAFADSSQWIRQELWVESYFDTDHDGRKDRLHVDVTRPRQTETEGLKVPIVYQSSPYYAGTAKPQINWDVHQEIGAVPTPRAPMSSPPFDPTRTRISNALVSEWVPRGFAVVHSEAPGTGRSEGCPTGGDDPERYAPKAVIDWLNGRAKGFTTETGNVEVKATSWSTGKVGMIGTSYVGTIPLSAATTGVKGLEVIIPVSPGTSFYHYYRSNGLIRSGGGYHGEDIDVLYDFIATGEKARQPVCENYWKYGVFAGPNGQDRVTGAMNDFWKRRDLLPLVKNIKSAVLLAHGLNDYNVVPEHTVRIYNEMKARGLPVSMYLHTGGHGGNPPAEMINRWFSHYLYGVDNGVDKDPPVWIVQDDRMQAPAALIAAHTPPPSAAPGLPPTGRGRGGGGGRGAGVLPTPFASFPVPGSVPLKFYGHTGGNTIGSLAFTAGPDVRETLVDDYAFSGSANASAASSTHRLLYALPAATDTVHISGTPQVTLRVAASKPAANLSIWLVTLPYDSMPIGTSSYRGAISQGWADIRKYKSLTHGGSYESMDKGEPLVPGRFYDLTFDLEPADEFIPAGQRLAVMIMSSDREFTLWPTPGTELTVDLAHSSFTIPIVGGTNALAAAHANP